MSNVSRSNIIESLSIDSPVPAADRATEAGAPRSRRGLDSDRVKFWLGLAIFFGILVLLAALGAALSPGDVGDAIPIASQ